MRVRRWRARGLRCWGLGLLAIVATSPAFHPARGWSADTDRDGLPDSLDACPTVSHDPGFDWHECAPMDGNPANDPEPQCRARERVVQTLLSSGVFVTHIAFAVVSEGELHFADAFSYIGAGAYEHDPDGIHRLYRIGSTTKAITAVAAKAMEEAGALSLNDYVNDDDATRIPAHGERTLLHLLRHQGAFKTDYGAIHLFCYPADLGAFWREPDDLVSPHYDSAVYGNLGGGYQYSAFNYSLAGAYMANQAGHAFAEVLQERVLDPAGMCTASLDGARATASAIGPEPGVSQAAVMHVGPYINMVSPGDSRCEDNFYSSDDLYGDPYSWQVYHLDEAGAEARDPAGGVIASVIDLAHFAEALLASYRGEGALLSPEGIRELWGATTDLGCAPNCPYERYYGTGFFTATQPGMPVTQVGHGGSRAGFASGFVLRPEDDRAVIVLANADVSTVALSDLAKTILDDIDATSGVAGGETSGGVLPAPAMSAWPNPLGAGGTTEIRFALPQDGRVELQVFDVRGRRVTDLAAGWAPAGNHIVTWRPADRGLVSGTYFVRYASPGTLTFLKVVITP